MANGYRVTLHFLNPHWQEPDDAATTAAARQWFGIHGCSVSVGWPPGTLDTGLVLATTWQSAVFMAGLQTAGRKLHFVQDYEAWFHPMGDEYLAAAQVHDRQLPTVVIGEWLHHHLQQSHGLGSWTIPFTADLEVYRPAVREPDGKRVVAMYQPDKPRRCGNLMRHALRLVLDADPDVEIVTVGSPYNPALGERHRHLGHLSRGKLAEEYAAGSVGLSISSSNPSRVPFEMMATGLPVVEVGLPNTVFDLPERGCALAAPNPDSIARAILDILADPVRRSAMSGAAVDFMARRPAERELKEFEAAVAATIRGDEPPRRRIGPQYDRSLVRCEPMLAWDGHGLPGGEQDFMDPGVAQMLQNRVLLKERDALSLQIDECREASRLSALERDEAIAEITRFRRHPLLRAALRARRVIRKPLS